MPDGPVTFAEFTLDPAQRTLHRGPERLDVSGRYMDALLLMVREGGRLVTKDRFMAEVWRGVPVTDEALTQCIRTLRRRLGDDAANPRFIETVPKHGYRFLAAVEPALAAAGSAGMRGGVLRAGAAGTLGAAVAGLIGGVAYGAAGASGAGAGGASVLLVLTWLTIVVALAGGAGVSFGMAAGARFGAGGRVAGGAAGGLIVGGAAKLLGLDAFHLLLGRSPGNITGAGEGLLLGAAAGLGAVLGDRWGRGVAGVAAIAGAVGAVGGGAVVLAGGRLMGGSLNLLARAFPTSRLGLEALFGGGGTGAALATAAAEGALFAACIAAAVRLASAPRG